MSKPPPSPPIAKGLERSVRFGRLQVTAGGGNPIVIEHFPLPENWDMHPERLALTVPETQQLIGMLRNIGVPA